jgi:hypothetical protein
LRCSRSTLCGRLAAAGAGKEDGDGTFLAVITQLRRGFDLVCTLAGLLVLLVLGPWLLLISMTTGVPEGRELIRLDGVVVSCRETMAGAVMVLAGRETRFQSGGGSCADVLGVPDRASRISIFVPPVGSKARPAPARIASFGLSVDGKIVREPRSDLEGARIDRAFRFVVGLLGTAGCVWLLVATIRTRGGVGRLLLSQEPSADDEPE